MANDKCLRIIQRQTRTTPEIAIVAPFNPYLWPRPGCDRTLISILMLLPWLLWMQLHFSPPHAVQFPYITFRTNWSRMLFVYSELILLLLLLLLSEAVRRRYPPGRNLYSNIIIGDRSKNTSTRYRDKYKQCRVFWCLLPSDFRTMKRRGWGADESVVLLIKPIQCRVIHSVDNVQWRRVAVVVGRDVAKLRNYMKYRSL